MYIITIPFVAFMPIHSLEPLLCVLENVSQASVWNVATRSIHFFFRRFILCVRLCELQQWRNYIAESCAKNVEHCIRVSSDSE